MQTAAAAAGGCQMACSNTAGSRWPDEQLTTVAGYINRGGSLVSAPTMSEVNVPFPTVQGAANAHGGVSAAGENPWSQFFGPAAGSLVTSAYDKYAEQTFDLPEAYRGKNLFLRDTIDGLITDGSKPQWYTTVALPWAQTDQITFSWNEFHFNETLAGRVPHEGISRLVTSSRAARNEKSVRRGLAMVLEHGFMSTKEGQDQYRMNLQGIAQCVQETANHDVMNALLTANNYDRAWEKKHGVRNEGVRQMVEQEVYNYAVVQKTPHGLDILVEEVKQRMGRYGSKPDLMVIPPRLGIYLTMVRPEKTQYYLAGPDGSQNLREGPEALASFRGLRTFESRSFDVYSGEPPIDLALRNRQVGEYYVLEADDEAIDIYDEELDNWVTITFREARAAFGETGGIAGPDTDEDEARSKTKYKTLSPFPGGRLYGNPDLLAKIAHQTNSKHGSTVVEMSTTPDGAPCINHVRGADPTRFPIVDRAVATGVYNPNPSARSAGRSDNTNYDQFLHDARRANLSMIEDAKRMFDPTQDHALQTKLSEATGAEKLTVTSTSGFTGHPAMHCSYRGLGVIESDGNIEQKQIASPLRVLVDSIANMTNLPNKFARGHMPPNYTFSADGVNEIHAGNKHSVKSYVFQVLMDTSCGHTLCPVTSDGEADALAATLPGDTIVCHSLARAHFLDSPRGIVGRLALTNCSEGIVGAMAHNMRGNEQLASAKWALGEPGCVLTHNYFRDAANAPVFAPVGFSTKRARDQGSSNQPAAYASILSNRPAKKPDRRQAVQRSRAPSSARADGLAYAQSLIFRHRHAPRSTVCHPNGILRDVGIVYKNENDKKIFTDFAMNNPATPTGERMLLMRPFIEHQMYSVVVMRGGAETGATYYGHNSVTVGDDAVSKMHYANFTFYQKALVRQPKNVYVAEDVFAAGYIGGNNTKFFKGGDIAAELQGAAHNRPSLLVALLDNEESLPNPLSITGEWEGALRRADPTEAPTGATVFHYSSCAQTVTNFKLATLLSMDPRVSGNNSYSSPVKSINTVCFKGACRHRKEGGVSSTDHNTGHWGHTYPGVKSVRAGHNKYMREMEIRGARDDF